MERVPLVSIVCVTYNHVAYISKALESCLAQECDFHFELLVGEDESTDGTREICQRLAKDHPDRIRLFLRSRKDVMYIMGRPTGRANLLHLFAEARGKYIAICEGDDYWTDPLKLQKQVDFLEAHPEYVVAYHDASIVDREGRMLRASKVPDDKKRDHTAEELQRNETFILMLSIMFRAVPELVDPIHEHRGIPNGDNFITSILGCYGKGKYLADISPAVYRQHSGGVWSSQDQASRERMQLSSMMWMAAYHNRKGRHELAAHFLEKTNERIRRMSMWYQLRQRRSYQWFAKAMGWMGVSMPQ